MKIFKRSGFMHGLILAVFCLVSMSPDYVAHAAEPEIVVFAAASTTNAVTEIGNLYAEKGLGSIKCSFASSSTLAKQIEQGAPADVFLSANIKWMDYLDEKSMVAVGSRKNILRNRIALIVPSASGVQAVEINSDADLVAILGKEGRMAVGDPAHVPVGTYGKQALETLGLWDSVKDSIAPTKDVRAGLAMVEQGEAPLGLVYSSDVAASDKVRIIGLFPESSHPEIIYPVGAVAGNKTEAAGKFIEFLSTLEARAIFKKYGFDGM
ncbi:molybdate ABC transporter substrate-binding protein [Desulfovibrio sp. OttesenSCG-928-C06]|nr:molybdate ABC transporter substrate-binding protein [Desulfovibrio sp. OttesenSCG-928-C06]